MEAYYTCSYIAALHSGRVFWLDKYTQYTHWTKNPDFAHCALLPCGQDVRLRGGLQEQQGRADAAPEPGPPAGVQALHRQDGAQLDQQHDGEEPQHEGP